MEPRCDAEVTGVDEWAEINRRAGLVGLEHGCERFHHRGFAQVCHQQLGALAEASRMAISAEEQHPARIHRVWDGTHPSKGASAVMKGVGRHGDFGLLKGHTAAFKPGEGQELMHG